MRHTASVVHDLRTSLERMLNIMDTLKPFGRSEKRTTTLIIHRECNASPTTNRALTKSQNSVFTLSWRYSCVPKRTTTPPSGVSVRTESRRTGVNCGVVRFHQITEKATLFESVSISMKGGWKETRGVQRPISAEIPVSESRIAPLNPFETKRKKAPSGTSSRVCDVQVAVGTGLASNLLHTSRY